MRQLITLLAAILTFNVAFSQGSFSKSFEQKLDPFHKIVVSPKIDLVLIPGETESIRIEYIGVDKEKIIIDQSGKKVHVYLEDAKIFDIGERRQNMFDRRERYRMATVTAYVTFKSLSVIETRGEGSVYCDGKIAARKLKIKAYGDTDVRLAYVDAAKVKARLYGDNTMKIMDGDAGHISYKLFGDNKIDSRGLRCVTSNTTIYGDGQVSLNATEEVRLNSFGDPSLFVTGSPNISKGIVIGHTNIRRN